MSTLLLPFNEILQVLNSHSLAVHTCKLALMVSSFSWLNKDLKEKVLLKDLKEHLKYHVFLQSEITHCLS